MCLDAEDAGSRLTLVDILRKKKVLTEDLERALDFVDFVGKHGILSPEELCKFTVQTVLDWTEERRKLFLAEGFLKSKSKHIVTSHLICKI